MFLDSVVISGCSFSAAAAPRSHVDLLLGEFVIIFEVRAHVLRLVEDVHELHDETVTLLF